MSVREKAAFCRHDNYCRPFRLTYLFRKRQQAGWRIQVGPGSWWIGIQGGEVQGSRKAGCEQGRLL